MGTCEAIGRLSEGTLHAKIIRMAMAAILAFALVPAISAEQAFASEPKFIGTVYYPVAYDENGYPLYNEDGTVQRGNPYVTLRNVENASGTLVVPAKFDVVERAEDGTETIHESVTPASISIGGSDSLVGGMGEDNWKNDAITSIDLTQCLAVKTVSFSRLPKVESVNMGGLPELANISYDRCKALSSVNTDNCAKLSSLTIMNCGALEIPDFSLPQWKGLMQFQARSQFGFDAFDASKLSELNYLSFSDTDLSAIDVSQCSKLKSLSLSGNQLTELDAASIPESVDYFNCQYNRINDTDALVARFGKSAVLPQGDSGLSSSVQVFNPLDYQGSMLPGESREYGLSSCYHPSSEESSNYWKEDANARGAASNFTATSSDPSIASVKITEEYGYPTLNLATLKAGTTKLTVRYSFEGDYGTYAGEQTVDFVVAASDNPVVAVSCDVESVEVPLPGSCAICGETHQSYGTRVPIETTTEDPGRPQAGSSSIEVKSSDESIVAGSLGIDIMGETVTRTALLIPKGLGSATVTVRGVDYIDGEPVYTDPATFQVEVVELPNPTLNVLEAITVFPTEYSEGGYSNSNTVVSPYGSIASYVENDALSSVTGVHGNGFTYGYPIVSAECQDVYSATSDNEDIVSVVRDSQRNQLMLQYKAAGTAHVTVEDVWGNKGTCTVTVMDRMGEVEKLSLSRTEITIKQGEAFDLSKLVEGMDKLDPYLAGIGGLLVFKSSNGYIAPIKWNLDGNLDDSLPHYVSQIYGRNVGDATVSANVLTGGDMGGSIEYIDQWGVTQFDELTVHVVPADAPTGNPATAVEVTGDSDSVELGSTLQLSAAVTPADADDADTLKWVSSDASVATVDASGKVTPIALGKATITATVGSVSDTFEVTVVEKSVPATDVTISAADGAMKVGDTQQLTATVVPTDSTDEVVWSSSDEDVLAVDQSGLVTAVGNGEASIQVVAGVANDETQAITVTTPVTGVSLDAAELELYVGADASKLTATVAPTTASNKAVTWKSSNVGAAAVDADGNVSPVAAGTATVTATTVDGGYTASCEVTVKQHAEGVALDKHELTLTGAESSALKATVAPDNATNKDVTWASSDESVATVAADGVVTSVGKGAATITVTTLDGDFSDTCAVTVKNPAITLGRVEPSPLNLVKGETADVTVSPAGALPGEVDDLGAIVWSSSNEAVVKVSDGTVTAVSTGTTKIKAEVHLGETEMGDTWLASTGTVYVTNPVKSVSISETSKTATVGDGAFTLKATVDPADADDPDVTWISTNPAVVTVDADGNVAIKAAGSASIVASAGGKSAACALTVKAMEMAKTPAGSGFSASVAATDSATVEVLKKHAEEGLNLAVQAIAELTAPAKAAVEKLAADGAVVAETFDIHFAKDNGEEIVLSAGEDGAVTLTVKMALTDSMRALLGQGMDLQVHYVGEDGTVEDKQTWVEGDYLCFVTEHFSDYVVTGVPSKDEGEQGSGGQGSDDQKPAALPAGGNGSALASTGDPVGATALVLGMLACLAAGTVAWMRRKAR
ncbi:Ig-like domain-containing protein [Gordonibacter massiliensis (ex Traore et al. 2017)]|uniref:Ig-like domain-containing protein n=1 Tax=Gordonibacter massiliensis (ex Traore et al. 2017) TaxID=1841863 RepID=UPI001C8C5D5A|nr:Ig-like domain-containing protein [Gordonibacter massiliensis (ex Traore et al. 2017)]MBX9033406.1 hypothetical protein [Gordonibacter massiliensis (ex Traore et al. 2017)]